MANHVRIFLEVYDKRPELFEEPGHPHKRRHVHAKLHFVQVIIIIIITFTWSGPSGVLGCTGQRPGGPAARGCMPSTQCGGCRAVPLNLLNLPVGRNLRGGKRSRSQVWEG
jgi:hypothetical protein